jgi:hypothetical protein
VLQGIPLKFRRLQHHAGEMPELRINGVLVLLPHHATQHDGNSRFLFVFDGVWQFHGTRFGMLQQDTA